MYLAVLTLVLLSACSAQSPDDCSLLKASDLGNTTSYTNEGLLALTLNIVDRQGADIRYQLVDYNTVCLAQGSGRGLYRMVSVVASYMFLDNGANGATVGNPSQFQFECKSNQWSPSIFGNFEDAFSGVPGGNLNTPLRTDCRVCAELTQATTAEHCLRKLSLKIAR